MFTLAFLLLLWQQVVAQDTIVTVNGDEIAGWVKEITMDEIRYQLPDTTDKVLHQIRRAEVFMIKFANGTKEIIAQPQPAVQDSAMSADQMYLLGKEDALRNYKGNGAMWGSAGCALLLPYGLAGSAAIGLVRPKAHNNPVSNVNYLSDPNFVKGYEDQARKKKTGKVLAGTGIGVVTSIAVLIIALTSMPY